MTLRRLSSPAPSPASASSAPASPAPASPAPASPAPASPAPASPAPASPAQASPAPASLAPSPPPPSLTILDIGNSFITPTPCTPNHITFTKMASSTQTPATVNTPPKTPLSPYELEQENHRLKEELARLTTDRRCILDHSIESDARLLQFTTEIFAVSSPHHNSATSLSKPTQTENRSTQCNTLHLTDTELPNPERSFPPKPEPDPDIMNSLKITIEVLEAEVNMLRLQAIACQCHTSSNPWTTVTNKTHKPIATSNRFNPLHLDEQPQPSQHKPYQSQNSKKPPRNRKPRYTSKTKTNSPPPPKPLSFESVVVRGDSHARDIAGMAVQLLQQRGTVLGICKPGAKLQQVMTPRPQQPVKGTRCDVLIAGTNDLATGKHHNLYQALESSIKSQPVNTKLILATLPHRHDLPPNHNINQETALVNAYIEELGARHNIVILDFNKVQRRYFTRHGMHLRRQGKWQLARGLVDALYKAQASPRNQGLSRVSTRAAAPRTTRISPTKPAEPFTLPHDTYADAAKTVLRIKTASDYFNLRTNCPNFREYFLGNPTLAPPKN